MSDKVDEEILGADDVEAALQQWNSQWFEPPKPKPKPNSDDPWRGCPQQPSPLVSFNSMMNQSDFQELQAKIARANPPGAQYQINPCGKVLVRGREIFDGRARYLAYRNLQLKPPMEFINSKCSDRDMLIKMVHLNIRYRQWTASTQQAFFDQASAVIAKLTNPLKAINQQR